MLVYISSAHWITHPRCVWFFYNNRMELHHMDGQNLKPIILHRADPLIYRHTDGYYYFTATVPAYDRIELRRAGTLEGLSTATPKTVWTKHQDGPMSHYIWAPEIHHIEGKWYIYFAADNKPVGKDSIFDHRMYVLENIEKNPMEGEWTEKGQIVTNWESFSLDETTFSHNGVRYLVWAQRDYAIRGNSNLYIAQMRNPWTIEGKQVLISKPEYDWETIGFWVNEGPAILKKNGRIFITYSASATDSHYCMGMLWAYDDEDLLDPASWYKSATPVFKTDEFARIYGPGHNSFTVGEDGADILVFHARDFQEIAGNPLEDANRHTYVKAVYWDESGMPVFG